MKHTLSLQRLRLAVFPWPSVPPHFFDGYMKQGVSDEQDGPDNPLVCNQFMGVVVYNYGIAPEKLN